MHALSRVTGLIMLLAPLRALAAPPVVPACPLSFLPCGGGGVGGAVAYFWGYIFPSLKLGFVGFALLMFFYYGVQLLTSRQDENVQTEAKSAYEMAIFGCVVVMLATIIVDSFNPGGTNTAPITGALANIILYFKIALASVVTLRITIQGVRLIILEGQAEGELEKQKKQFLNGLFGVGVILLVNALVTALFPGTGSVIIANELVGISNFLLELAGAGAVLAILGAGAMLLVSVDESLKDRAKKTISGAIITLVVIISAYVLVNYFLAL